MPGPDWDDASLSLLRQKTAEGMKPAEMVRLGLFPGRSLNAICKARHNYRLVAHTEASAKTREGLRKRLRGARRARYIAFLRSELGRAMSSGEIAAKFGLKPRLVREHRVKYDAAPTYEEVTEGTRAAQRAAALRRHRDRQLVEEFERRKLQVRREREDFSTPLRRCRRCREKFFATKDFFAEVQKKRDSEVAVYLSRRCRSCDIACDREKWDRYRSTRKNRSQAGDAEVDSAAEDQASA